MKNLENKDYIWVIIFLIFTIIVLLSYIIVYDEESVEMVSSVATITSIILSVFAIMQTVYNSAESRMLNNETKNQLNLLSDKIKEVSEKIEIQTRTETLIKQGFLMVKTQAKEKESTDSSGKYFEISEKDMKNFENLFKVIDEDGF